MIGLVTLYLSFIVNIGEQKDEPKSFEASGPIIKVSKVDYESLPSYMKSLAPWEVWSLCDETAWHEVYVMKLHGVKFMWWNWCIWVMHLRK